MIASQENLQHLQDVIKRHAKSDAFRFLGLSSYPLLETYEPQWKVSSLLDQDPLLQWAEWLKTSNHESIAFHQLIGEQGFITLADQSSLMPFSVMQLNVPAQSNAEWVIHQDFSKDKACFIRLNIQVQNKAHINLVLVQTGSAKCQTKIDIQLQGTDASCDVQVLNISGHQQTHESWVNIFHLDKNTKSNMNAIALVDDHAKSIFKGALTISAGAPGSEAYQKSHGLMLSDTAQIDAIPELWIEQDDVKCAHGSAVSQIDPDQIFYLCARGLNQDLARNMVIDGWKTQFAMRALVPDHRQKLYQILGLVSHDE
jgi:hypothetical protein